MTIAAAGMLCFIRIPGTRQGHSLPPIRISVGTVNK
jgi:hypothetical protein